MALTVQRRKEWTTDAKVKEATRVFFGPRATVDADAPVIGDSYPDDTTLKVTKVNINYYFSEDQSEVTAYYSNAYLYEGASNLTEYEYDISMTEKTVSAAMGESPIAALPEEVGWPIPCVIYRVTKYKTAINYATVFALTGKLNDAAFLGEVAKTWMFHGVQAYRDQWSLFRVTYTFEYRPTYYYAWQTVHFDKTTSPPTVINHDIYLTGNFDLLGL